MSPPPERPRTIQVTIGPCTFVYEDGLQCSCSYGFQLSTPIAFSPMDAERTAATHFPTIAIMVGASISVIDKGGFP